MVDKPIVVCVTGASGAVYAMEVIKQLAKAEREIYLIFSENGKKVFVHETGGLPEDFIEKVRKKNKRIIMENNQNLFSPVASGGRSFDVLICPCSSGTLGRIASGISSNLIERAADVALKEKNKLICVTRESPLSVIHIDNMLKLSNAGAVIMPASPFFYLSPDSLESLIKQFADRILKVLLDNYTPRYFWKGHDAL